MTAASETDTFGTRRRYWARAILDRRTLPQQVRYGSTEWLCLPDDHPDKLGSAVVAAECWAATEETLESDLHREIAAARLANKRLDDAEYAEQVEAHREWATSLQSTRPSFMARRQAQLDAIRPQPGDFHGRSGA